jgi:acetyl-CoA acetyltransferase family protein
VVDSLFAAARDDAMDRSGRSCHRHRVRPTFVLDAVRTPIGGRGGSLASCHPADLVAHLLGALVERLGAFDVDDVVLGCAMPVGNQGFNLARNAVLGAGWPETVPAGTIDRQGVSGFAAFATAVHAVASGAAELVVAGGVEHMSTTPAGATLVPGAQPFGPAMAARYRDRGGLLPPGVAAEAFGLPRAALDAYAFRSHARAVAAAPDRSMVATVLAGGGLRRDELPRSDLTEGELSEARPAFVADGAVTALNSGAMADGAAVLVVASERVVEALGRPPLARVAGIADVGVDPLATFAAAVPASRAVLQAAGVEPGALARVELAEPFAAVPLAFLGELAVDDACVNPAGGGIALGEPTGAVGARLLATLAHGLADAGGRWGLAAGVATGGLGTAVLLERV